MSTPARELFAGAGLPAPSIPIGTAAMLPILLVSMLLAGCGEAPLYKEPQEIPVQAGLEPDADPRWTILPGRTPAPALPAAMIAVGDRVFLLHGAALSEYDAAAAAWKDGDLGLPGEVGSGAALATDGKSTIWILRGGRQTDFWRADLAARRVEALAKTPNAVGRGGSLAFDPDRNQVYALRGDLKRDCWRYDVASDSWEKLTRVGDQTALASIGQSTGALQYWKGFVYAWPDHHIQRFDIEKGTWLDKVHMSYGQRPWWDGSAFAADPEAGAWYVVQGGGSRTLSWFHPEKRGFAFLRPRLPVRMSGEGSRGVVVKIDGKKHLLVYAVQQENRLLRIALDQLEPITPQSPRSDAGSAWTTFHEKGGSSLVRRAAFVPVLGMMGKAGKRWYFGRLQNMRFFDVRTNEWTGYPGVVMGRKLAEGLCGAADEKGRLYVLTGESRHFVLVDQETMAPAAPLAPPPFDANYGAQAVWSKGRLFVLAGGETRASWSFDPAANAWSAGPDLPEEATPVGAGGSGLFESRGRIVAVSATGVFRLAENGSSWAKAMDLPFAPSANGGMVAGDPANGRFVVVEGGGSRRLLALDLDDPARQHEHLLPDVVSVVGMRAIVDLVDGVQTFFVHRGHDTHEIFRRPMDELYGGPPAK